MDKICGFNVGNKGFFKLVENDTRPGHDIPHYVANFKKHVVEIYPSNDRFESPMKLVYEKGKKVPLFLAHEGRSYKLGTDGDVILLKSITKGLLKKAQECIRKV